MSILLMMGRVLMETFTSPLFIVIYFILFIIISLQYRRLGNISERILESKGNSYLRSALISSLLALLGGLLGSCTLVFLGISLDNIGILQLWLLAVLLMLINPRFLCFAYAGGILAVFSLLTGVPDINIPQLIALIAVLHMVESLLILLDGHLNPVPIYIKKENEVRGGFNLQKFWPLPLIALITISADPSAGGIAMPDWWPLLSDAAGSAQNYSYGLIPVLAVLGYGEISTTDTPRQRTVKSARRLFLFSLSLLLVSVLASHWDKLLIVAALLSPLGHEFVIWLGIREENKEKAVYIKPEQGIMVLDVKPGSLAKQAGIKSQDIILCIDGEILTSPQAFKKLWRYGRKTVEVEILRGGQRIRCSLDGYSRKESGIIAVPETNSRKYLILSEGSFFHSICRFFKRFIRCRP